MVQGHIILVNLCRDFSAYSFKASVLWKDYQKIIDYRDRGMNDLQAIHKKVLQGIKEISINNVRYY